MFEDRTKVATAAIAMALAGVAWGQEPTNRFNVPDTPPSARMPSKIAPDFHDVDYAQIAKVVSQMSGRTLVLGPGVCALVSASWETALTGQQFYQAFVSISQALGFVVVEEGSVTTITLTDARKGSSTCGRYPNLGT